MKTKYINRIREIQNDLQTTGVEKEDLKLDTMNLAELEDLGKELAGQLTTRKAWLDRQKKKT